MPNRHYFGAHNKSGSSQFLTSTGRKAIFRAGFCICDDDKVAAELKEFIEYMGADSPYYIPAPEELIGLEKAAEYGVSPETGGIVAQIEQEIMKKLGLLPKDSAFAAGGIATSASANASMDPAQAHNVKPDMNALLAAAELTGKKK